MACRIMRHCQIADGGKQLCRRLALVHRQQVGQSEDAPQGDPSPRLKRNASGVAAKGRQMRQSRSVRSAARADRGETPISRRAIPQHRPRPDPADPRDPRGVVVATGGCVRHHHLRDGAGSGAGGFGRSACVYRRSNGARRISATSGYKGSDDRRAGR
jgi:hypothetical protein